MTCFRSHGVGSCQGAQVDPAPGGGLMAGLSWWLGPPATAGVKVQRPAGRTTLTPARTGAGSGDEKARTAVRSWLTRTHSAPELGVGFPPGGGHRGYAAMVDGSGLMVACWSSHSSGGR
jgi:hypothetical protein